MSGEVRPTVRTPIRMEDYLRAVVEAWPHVFEGEAPREAAALLYAQFTVEVGPTGQNCYGWNIGNVKHTDGDGFDFHYLQGVWEGLPVAEASRLIASGQVTRDPSPSHAAAVGAGKVSVIFQPPHPATRFRSFDSLGDAMREHLGLLSKRFAPAWPFVLAGDVTGFARALSARHYFTANPEAYAAIMRPAYARALASEAYDEAVSEGVGGMVGALRRAVQEPELFSGQGEETT